MHVLLRRPVSAALLSALLVATGAAGASADCKLPGHAPVMPQGATASEEEMKEGHDALQKFVNELQTYQKCMEQQVKDAPPDTKPDVKQRWQAEADAAIDAAQQIADVYSAQLRAYKARTQ